MTDNNHSSKRNGLQKYAFFTTFEIFGCIDKNLDATCTGNTL